jgi:hypothetical protein
VGEVVGEGVGVVVAAGASPGTVSAGLLLMVTTSAHIPISKATAVMMANHDCFDGPTIVMLTLTMTMRRIVANRVSSRRGQAASGEGRLRRSVTQRVPSQNIDESPFGNPADSGSPVALRPRLATGVPFQGGRAAGRLVSVTGGAGAESAAVSEQGDRGQRVP